MTTSTGGAVAGSVAVDRLLDAIRAGSGLPDEILAPDVVLDATVPGWRFSATGRTAVSQQYGSWFRSPGELEELERLTVDDGQPAVAGGHREVVTYLLTWEEDRVPHAAHHCHVLRLDAAGRIAADRFFCGGKWDAALLARMAEARQGD